MKKFLSMILSAMLAPQALFAGPLAVSLSNMKPVVRSQNAQSSALVPVAYKEIPGPGRKLPENPPILGQAVKTGLEGGRIARRNSWAVLAGLFRTRARV